MSTPREEQATSDPRYAIVRCVTCGQEFQDIDFGSMRHGLACTKPIRATVVSSGREASAARRFAALCLGMREFRLNVTTRYVTPELRNSYDWGREWAHRISLRRFES